MSGWRAEFTPIGVRDLSRLEKSLRSTIVDKVEWLAENFDVLTPIPLHADFKLFFKLRIGDWRAAYTFDPNTKLIKIRLIDHRSKIYKRLR